MGNHYTELKNWIKQSRLDEGRGLLEAWIKLEVTSKNETKILTFFLIWSGDYLTAELKENLLPSPLEIGPTDLLPSITKNVCRYAENVLHDLGIDTVIWVSTTTTQENPITYH